MAFTINQHCSDVILFFAHAIFSCYLFNFRNTIKHPEYSISLQLAELTRGKGDRFTGPLSASGRLLPDATGAKRPAAANGYRPVQRA